MWQRSSMLCLNAALLSTSRRVALAPLLNDFRSRVSTNFASPTLSHPRSASSSPQGKRAPSEELFSKLRRSKEEEEQEETNPSSWKRIVYAVLFVGTMIPCTAILVSNHTKSLKPYSVAMSVIRNTPEVAEKLGSPYVEGFIVRTTRKGNRMCFTVDLVGSKRAGTATWCGTVVAGSCELSKISLQVGDDTLVM